MQKVAQKICRHSLFFLLLLIGSCFFFPAIECHADEPYIIVIDPGHGGNNLGAEHDGYTEKEMTMAVAKSMKEELERYDNVIVYLTHEQDEDMSIKDRALFAKKRKADFLFSLHFNASVHHNLYGAEVWVPAYSDLYVLGRQFAEIEMQLLSKLGIYSRGIKTKLNNAGNDYYGILRYCSAENIPSVLIEHCHMDHPIDQPFFQTDKEQLAEFGRLDAEAVAKFLGLSSAELGIDYSTYPLTMVEKPANNQPVLPDKSAPELCTIEVLSVEERTGKVSVRMKASDEDSYIQYYSYSLDGGKTYSELQKWARPFWNQSDEELVFSITVPLNQEITLMTRAYNGFDGYTDSNQIILSPIIVEEVYVNARAYEKVSVKPVAYEEKRSLSELNLNDKVQLCILILFISFFMTWILFVMLKMIFYLKKDNKQYKLK